MVSPDSSHKLPCDKQFLFIDPSNDNLCAVKVFKCLTCIFLPWCKMTKNVSLTVRNYSWILLFKEQANVGDFWS